MYLDTLLGIQCHAIIDNQVDSTVDNDTAVKLNIFVDYPPAAVPGLHIIYRLGICGSLHLAVSIDIAVSRKGYSIKWADRTSALNIGTSTDGNFSTHIMTSNTFTTVANVAICFNRTAIQADGRTGQCLLSQRTVISTTDGRRAITISRYRTTIDGNSLDGSAITATNTCTAKTTSCINSSAVDGNVTGNIVNVSAVAEW